MRQEHTAGDSSDNVGSVSWHRQPNVISSQLTAAWFVFVEDALGAWYNMVQSHAHSKKVNEIAREVGLHLAPFRHDLVGGACVWRTNGRCFGQGPLVCGELAVESRMETLATRGPHVWNCLSHCP